MDRIKRLYTGDSADGATKRKWKLLLVALFSTLFIAVAVIGIAASVRSSNENPITVRRLLQSHATIQSACSSTFYPDLCFSAVAFSTEAAGRISSNKDVIEASLNLTIAAVQHNFFAVKKLIADQGGSFTKREKTALHDCLETIDETLDELHEAVEDLHLYPKKKSLQQHADDLKTLLSSAITNQETCLDGFSHDSADKKVRKALLAGQVHVEKMCSNALAMIKNLTDTDMEIERRAMSSRKLREEEEERPASEAGWPEWLSAGDRRLLQSSTVTPDVVVAADGSGNYKTVSAAVAAAPEQSSKRYVIKIKAGVYRENVDVSKKKKNIMFIGDGRTNTIITGSRSVVGGSTTFNSATVGEPTTAF
ncbi:hypothetical protein SAY86_008860 [Trapa natans]|uniref:pectinesterase n=1 Tax=Trapa natans TaxID=22666 RepID=A0AAN7KAY5_TRANT|nr:hypothetical protein SAY86_008860 [Trapa natans]